ncbi:MAG TPA: PKD domain-containing protein, partial [Gemmatimonadaceae bacterium]|nr:PKD domain-containing protein [Gemmatimonadaceae bacterium]
LESFPTASPQGVRDALYAATTKGIVTSSSTANNHLLYSLVSDGSGGGDTNSPPTASFTHACTDLACDFDGTGSSDSDGTIASYAWDFGDGTTGSGATASHTYASGGTYSVVLTVTDDDGATGSQTQSVSVSSSSGGGEITLSATGYKVRGRMHADLTWSGATSTNVDVYRNGAVVATTANDGAYTDATNFVGGGTLTYKVCEAGTTTCSNDASVTF